jgi:hypothetical protein
MGRREQVRHRLLRLGPARSDRRLASIRFGNSQCGTHSPELADSIARPSRCKRAIADRLTDYSQHRASRDSTTTGFSQVISRLPQMAFTRWPTLAIESGLKPIPVLIGSSGFGQTKKTAGWQFPWMSSVGGFSTSNRSGSKRHSLVTEPMQPGRLCYFERLVMAACSSEVNPITCS